MVQFSCIFQTNNINGNLFIVVFLMTRPHTEHAKAPEIDPGDHEQCAKVCDLQWIEHHCHFFVGMCLTLKLGFYSVIQNYV